MVTPHKASKNNKNVLCIVFNINKLFKEPTMITCCAFISQEISLAALQQKTANKMHEGEEGESIFFAIFNSFQSIGFATIFYI